MEINNLYKKGNKLFYANSVNILTGYWGKVNDEGAD
jgi:hypothetical protein